MPEKQCGSCGHASEDHVSTEDGFIVCLVMFNDDSVCTCRIDMEWVLN